MKAKKVLALLMALGMLSSSLAGCSSEEAASSGDASSSSSTQESSSGSESSSEGESSSSDGELKVTLDGVEKISEEPITLKVFCPKGANTANYGDLEYLKAYSEATNISVEWEQPSSDLATDRMNVILASNELPDMFWNVRYDQYTQLRQSNAIIDLREYARDCENLNKVVEENPGVDKYFIEPDGKMYILPLFDGLSINQPLIVRQDWLDQLGMEVPETMDDWHDYWVAVRDNDVNGNGDPNDEIPFTAEKTDYLRDLVSVFDMMDGFFVDVADGHQIKFSNIDPRYKDFLTWMNQLWNENLIDHAIFSNDKDALESNVALNLVGSYSGKLNGQFNTYMTTMPEHIEGFKLAGAPPIESSTGKHLHSNVTPLARLDNSAGGNVVTVTSQYPAECVKFCDWFYDFTPGTGGGFYGIFGYEGVTFEYTNAEKTEYEYTDLVLNNPDGLSPQQFLQTLTTRNQYAAYTPPIGSFKMWAPETEEAYERLEPYYEESLEYTLPTNLPLTDAENKEIRSTMADINTYVDEMVIAFINGKEPLDNFDAYVDTVNNMGIQKILDIYNASYELWNQDRN